MWVELACSAYMAIVGDLNVDPSGCCMCWGGIRKVSYNIPWLLLPITQHSAELQEEKIKKS